MTEADYKSPANPASMLERFKARKAKEHQTHRPASTRRNPRRSSPLLTEPLPVAKLEQPWLSHETTGFNRASDGSRRRGASAIR